MVREEGTIEFVLAIEDVLGRYSIPESTRLMHQYDSILVRGGLTHCYSKLILTWLEHPDIR